MNIDPKDDPYSKEPVLFELANGNGVRVEAGKYWQKPSAEGRRTGGKPFLYHAVRIYSSEGCLTAKLTYYGEFRAHTDFDPERLDEVWDWLQEHIATRAYCEHDTLEEFIEVLADAMAESLCAEPDAVKHYEWLPSLTDPEAFDQVDDSIFNDQN